MPNPSNLAAMREALEAALQSHDNKGKAFVCDCSLCRLIRDALRGDAGKHFADRIREECAQVADWTANQIHLQLSRDGESHALQSSHKAAREIAERIRVLKCMKF